MKKTEPLLFFSVLTCGCCATAGHAHTTHTPRVSWTCPSILLSAGGAADQGVLGLHDKGRPHLGGRSHLRQRGLPCPRHPPGHQVISLLKGNRDHLLAHLCCPEMHTEEEGGWMVVGRSFLSTTVLKTQRWNGLSAKGV